MSGQERLDDLTEQLGAIIRGVDAIAKEARKEAGARCRAGQNDVSADLRDIEADLRQMAALGVRAYAKGRRLAIPDVGGGVIVPFGGGS